MNLAHVAGNHRFKADALEPFLHAAQIAHPVIDNRNHVLNDLNGLERLNVFVLETPLRRQHTLHPRVDLRSEIHRAGERFEASLDNMVWILAARHVDVQIHAQLIGEGGIKLVRQIRCRNRRPVPDES